MPKGGTTPTTQSTTTTLSPEQRQLMQLALPGVQQFAASVPQRYRGPTIAGFDPAQMAGQELALGGAVGQGQVADAATAALLRQLGGTDRTAVAAPTMPTVAPVAGPNLPEAPFGQSFWEPQNNAILRGAIEASTRPITEQLTQSILPAIRGEAVTTGNFGGSRQGIAEGLASREASRAIGDTAAKLAQATYGTNVGALGEQYKTGVGAELQKYGIDTGAATSRYGTDVGAALQRYGIDVGAGTAADRLNAETTARALGLVPTIQTAETAPAATVSAVGDVRQQLAQSLMNQNAANFNWDQYAPFLQSREIMSLLQGMPGATTTATASGPQVNPFTSALGGAATGAALGSALFPGVGTAVGAGGGALASLLFNR